MAEISRLPNVVCVKDATGDLGRLTAQRLACGEQFCQLSGNDETRTRIQRDGRRRPHSSSANVAPRLCAHFQEATREGR